MAERSFSSRYILDEEYALFIRKKIIKLHFNLKCYFLLVDPNYRCEKSGIARNEVGKDEFESRVVALCQYVQGFCDAPQLGVHSL